MQRSTEARWKLVDKQSYDEYENKITSIKQGSPAIAKHFQFKEDYDLSDALVNALYWYVRSKPRFSDMKKRNKDNRERLEIIGKLKSFKDAQIEDVVALTLAGLRSFEDPTDSKSRHKLAKACRIVNQQRMRGNIAGKQGGRYPDYATQNFCRTLPVIYRQGTGKVPASTWGRTGFRGRYLRFAEQCCGLLGLEIPERRLNRHMREVQEKLKDFGRK